MTNQRVGYASGVFDMFHIGHLNILTRAKSYCDYLVAGIATDPYVEQLKGRHPAVPYAERAAIVGALRVVDEVIDDESEDKSLVWHRRHFDVIFKGDDWKGTPKGERLEHAMDELGVEVVYFPYTVTTTSTLLRKYLEAATA